MSNQQSIIFVITIIFMSACVASTKFKSNLNIKYMNKLVNSQTPVQIASMNVINSSETAASNSIIEAENNYYKALQAAKNKANEEVASANHIADIAIASAKSIAYTAINAAN